MVLLAAACTSYASRKAAKRFEWVASPPTTSQLMRTREICGACTKTVPRIPGSIHLMRRTYETFRKRDSARIERHMRRREEYQGMYRMVRTSLPENEETATREPVDAAHQRRQSTPMPSPVFFFANSTFRTTLFPVSPLTSSMTPEYISAHTYSTRPPILPDLLRFLRQLLRKQQVARTA
ncbi:hypothetical protein HYPSUDRAFT_1044687 [Hypholoma sublateritium FD-334 SS-4]|uniref:Uncharacterized protein n=1 Tax=Hypholoma sublateritium (strain FD-334 SS-4) TaxID=945553 RepID=A0A0D2NDI0_HYPSF|nr:hypothetical protein HYPSUDRAFT_1044687 [Hypholoma sublateritium FD-334 SS-4]